MSRLSRRSLGRQVSHVLLDHNVPRRVATILSGHTVERAFPLGWATLRNGDLLDAVDVAGFDVFVTADQNLRFQQNLSQRQVAIVVIGTNIWPVIAHHPGPIIMAVRDAKPGSVMFVPYPKPPRVQGPHL